MVGNWSGDLPVHNLRQQNAHHNRKLVQTDKPAPYRCGADLGDIQRRDIRTETDRRAADDSPDDKRGKRVRPASQPRGKSKQDRGDQKDPLAAETISCISGQKRTNKTSNQRTTVCPSDKLYRGQLKVGLVKLPRPSD